MQPFAHGYICEPAGRSLLCKIGANGQCGAIQWEPQSLEAPSGFPHGGPPDGRIASAGHRHFGELDVQTTDRWTKQEVKAGLFPITWTFTANHVTRSWRYHLARPDWNPNQPLTRTAFDPEPFCIVYGQNLVYIQDASALARVEIELEQREPVAVNSISVSGLAAEYLLESGHVTLDFTVVAQGDLHITNTLYDQGGVAKGHSAADVKDDSRRFALTVSKLKAGHHQLVIKAMPKAGGAPLQQALNLTFKGPANDGYQYVFPQGLVSYAAGTKVLQPRNGRVYQCKPFPYSGYCVQWSSYATHYEPAVGSHWQLAWDEVK